MKNSIRRLFLPLGSAAVHGLAYVIYLVQVSRGGSVPNPSSWTVWAFMATLNALTFWQGTKNRLATAQFFTGAVWCLVVWAYALMAGRFAALNVVAWVVLAMCLAASLYWFVKRNAVNANLVVVAATALSFIPTYGDVLRNRHCEQPLPWCLWTLAFAMTAANVVISSDRRRRWWLMTLAPVSYAVLHGVVAAIVLR